MSIISVISGKGGTGKTFVAINVACGLKKLGYSVLLIDCSFGVRNIDVCIGMTSHGVYNLKEWVENIAGFNDVLIKSNESYLPDFIPASLSTVPENFCDSFKDKIYDIVNDYDYIVIDTPSSSGTEFYSAVEISDDILAVTTESYFSRINTFLCTSRIPDNKQKYLIFNRLGFYNDDIVFEDISDESGAKIIGLIREDEYAYRSLIEAKPIVLHDTYSGREFENICKRIAGAYVVSEKKSRLFDRNRFILK